MILSGHLSAPLEWVNFRYCLKSKNKDFLDALFDKKFKGVSLEPEAGSEANKNRKMEWTHSSGGALECPLKWVNFIYCAKLRNKPFRMVRVKGRDEQTFIISSGTKKHLNTKTQKKKKHPISPKTKAKEKKNKLGIH